MLFPANPILIKICALSLFCKRGFSAQDWAGKVGPLQVLGADFGRLYSWDAAEKRSENFASGIQGSVSLAPPLWRRRSEALQPH
jgi:hypothetical protein